MRNSFILFCSRMGDNTKAFLDDLYNIVHAMGVTSREKVEIASYQFKYVAQLWYTQWKDSRPVESCLLEWEEFQELFLERYFTREKRQVNIEEFINLIQG